MDASGAFVAEIRFGKLGVISLLYRDRVRRGSSYAVLVAAMLIILTGFVGAKPALAGPQAAVRADRILVIKSERQLFLMQNGRVIKSYPIALGPHPFGTKRAQGDGRTPEGVYVIDQRHAHSPYHLALHISYPNTMDREQSAAAHRSPGGDIFIHGLPASYGSKDPEKFYKDWTEGCIAVGNTAIEQIWAAVNNGTPIEIRP